MSGTATTVPNVVNFSELSAQEQSKYVDFLVSNNFIFNNDDNGKEESFLATIKINTKKGGGSQTEQSAVQTLHDKENTITMNNNTLGNSEIKGYIERNGKTKQQNRILPKNTMKMKVNKSPLRKNNTSVVKPLQNISNCRVSKEQNEVHYSLSKDTVSKENNEQKGTVLLEVRQEENNSLATVEVRKQQILEKLQLKLQEANQLAEIEEETERNQLKQKQLQQEGVEYTMTETQKHAKENQNNCKKRQEEVQNSKRSISRSKSNNNNCQRENKSIRNISNNCKTSNLEDKNRDKSPIFKKRKNSKSKEEKRKACRISQELMQKNMKYISNLQEKKKEFTSQDRKKSVSPQITPRLSSTSQTQRSSSNSSTPNSRNILHKKELVQKQVIHKPPSTFEQVMERQSHLINSVCAQIPRRMMNKDYMSNLKNDQYQQQGEQCYEFNSFGSPTGNCPNTTNPTIPTDNTNIKSINSNTTHTTTRLHEDNDADDGEMEFKLYNIKNKKNNNSINTIQAQRASTAINSNNQTHRLNRNQAYVAHESGQASDQLEIKRTKLLQDIHRGLQVHLTELRQFSNQIYGLKPQKLSFPQILRSIDELYQAKFYENTLIIKMNAKNSLSKTISRQDSTKLKFSEDAELNTYYQMTHQSNKMVCSDAFEIKFSEFISEYFQEKYRDSKKQSEQHFLNFIVNIEYFLSHSQNYPKNHILALRTFTVFVQDLRTKEELLFYLFVREMLLKCTVFLEDNLETRIYETMNIELSLEQCQQVLEQVYGKKEQKIIDRFMQRLGESVLQNSNNEMNIGAHFFLDLALEDYIEGKRNKIYESSEYQQQQAVYQQTNSCQSKRDNEDIQEIFDTQEGQDSQDDDNEEEDNYNQLSSFEKLEYTFEQSFGDADHHNHQSRTQFQSDQQPQQLQKQLQLEMFPQKHKYDCFQPSNQLEQRIWDKMVQKIHEFLELVISDNYDSTNQSSLKFKAVERIVTQKINKMLQCLMYGCREQWLELLCIMSPSVNQDTHLNGLLNQLQALRSKQSADITNSQLSNFCKTVLQTKELSKAIGKLLLCVLMPDSQSNNANSYL